MAHPCAITLPPAHQCDAATRRVPSLLQHAHATSRSHPCAVPLPSLQRLPSRCTVVPTFPLQCGGGSCQPLAAPKVNGKEREGREEREEERRPCGLFFQFHVSYIQTGIALDCLRFQNSISWSSKQHNSNYAHFNTMDDLVLNPIQCHALQFRHPNGAQCIS